MSAPAVSKAPDRTDRDDRLSFDEVLALLPSSVTRRILRRAVQSGRFPAPDVQLTPKFTFWRRERVEQWLNARPSEGGPDHAA